MTFLDRITALASEVDLGMECSIRVSQDLGEGGNTPGRWYYQIRCYRRDVVTGEMGYGYGGKAYLSPHATDSELVQTMFGLYKSYWEHEARENFRWRGRQIFGPHIDIEALWEVAERTDARPPLIDQLESPGAWERSCAECLHFERHHTLSYSGCSLVSCPCSGFVPPEVKP